MRGPYVPHDPRLPVHGLGEQELPQLGFADEVLMEMVSSVSAIPCLPWADQVSDVTWNEVSPEWMYNCIPISDAILQQVKSLSGGHEIVWVGILFERPATLNAIERALFGSPYAFVSSQAVYDPYYEGAVPRIEFLVWARLRDSMSSDLGGGGGARSMDDVAKSLGGRLVYVMQLPAADAPRRPSVDFQQALDAQLGISVQNQPQETVLVPSTFVPAAPAPSPVKASGASSGTTLPWVLAGGAVAALLMWWWHSRSEAAGSAAVGAGR